MARRKRKREIDVRILLADDDPDIRDLLKMSLEGEGWEVFAARDGREALRLYHNTIEGDHYFDVLLLDVSMPRLNGIAVGLNIRNLEEFAEIPRAVHIYLTGYDLATTPEDLLEIHFADAYLRKPFTSEELIEKIKELRK